jgi:hypothetical protein
MSILLGIDQSHDRRRARGRLHPPIRRTRPARWSAWLIVVERKGLNGASADYIVRNGVARRRGVAGMTMVLALDAQL